MSALKDYAADIERLLNQESKTYEACAYFLQTNFNYVTSVAALRRYSRKYEVKKCNGVSVENQTTTTKSVKITPDKKLLSQPVQVLPQAKQQNEKFTVSREGKRVVVKEKDFTVNKLGLIFQVTPSTLYILDEQKLVTVPRSDGLFDAKELSCNAQYEVCGTKISCEAGSNKKNTTTTPSTTPKNRARKNKKKRSTPNTSSSIPIILPGFISPENKQTVISPPKTTPQKNVKSDNSPEKAKQTTGAASKTETTTTEIDKKLSSINLRLEELKYKISTVVGKKSRLLTLSESDEVALNSSFQCLICKGILTRPIFSSCCKSLIACKICWDWNYSESGMTNTCLKCRSKSGEMFEVNAMDEGLNVIKTFLNTP